MRVLLCGHFSYFIRTLRDRFRKEGHDVYWLSGADYEKRREKNFKWQYDFGFESSSMPEIINSVNPDVVIFLGAQDPYYGDFSDSEKAREYTSGLINIMQTTYSNGGRRTRFIYLSSEEVFSGRTEETYTEDTECRAYDSRGRTILQGESVVFSYQQTLGAEVYVLRIDHLYGMPDSWADMPYTLRPYMKQALRDGHLDVRSDLGYGMISEEDASFFIYTIASAESTKNRLYHLGSERYYDETEIGDAVNAGFKGALTVDRHDYDRPVHRRLDPARFDTEFTTHAFHSPSEDIERIASQISSHRRRYTDDAASIHGGIREGLKTLLGLLVPFIENTVIFAFVFFLDNHFRGGSFFSYIDFYLLYVLLFAVAFGQQQAAYSAVLATIGFIYRQQLSMTGFEVVVDYNTYVWIAQVFIAGLVVGNLKDRIDLTKEEDERSISYLKSRLSDVESVNTANVRIKGVLEKQIINQDDSLGKIYQITSRLDNSSPVEVLFDAAQVIEELMDTDDVAVYQVANADYARLFASTSPVAGSMGNSLQYTAYDDLYSAIRDKKVFINKNMNDELPMMASGIWSGDRLNVIIMLWGMDWESMTLSAQDRLTVIGLLIQNAIATSTRYIDALQEERYMPGLDVLDDRAFSALLNAFVKAKKKHLTDMTLLYVPDTSDLAHTAMKTRAQLRNSDYMGVTNRGRLLILLSNTDYDNAIRVQKRLEEAGIATQVLGDI